ncbi:hypothetical protein BC940DRAFT_370610 [Gongronella butleri]|nr:hypothetical protein BC940DRAFT_370610 [Gongronella butleri]
MPILPSLPTLTVQRLFVKKPVSSYAGVFGMVKQNANYKEPDQKSFTFIVSKKHTHKLAVHRNRARRRVVSCVHQHAELFPKGYNFMFHCGTGAITASWPALNESIVKAAHQFEKVAVKYRSKQP